MPRKPRRLVKCRAMKTDRSRQCRRWAMAGQAVCYMHGGAASRARDKAAAREMTAKIYADAEREVNEYPNLKLRWHNWRVKETARLLKMKPADVRPGDVVYAAIEHDRPDLTNPPYAKWIPKPYNADHPALQASRWHGRRKIT